MTKSKPVTQATPATIGQTATSIPDQSAVGNQTKYQKNKLVNAAAFKKHRDLVEALLEDGETYTKAAVEALIKAFEDRPTYEGDRNTLTKQPTEVK